RHGDADLRRLLRLDCDVLGRPAAAQRLRRRVYDHARHLHRRRRPRPRLRNRGRDRRHRRRDVPAALDPADRLGRAREPEKQGALGSRPPRNRGPGSHRGADAFHGRGFALLPRQNRLHHLPRGGRARVAACAPPRPGDGGERRRAAGSASRRRPMNLVPAAFYLRILPEIILSVFALLIMLIEGPARAGSRGRAAGWVALAGCLAALASVLVQAANPGDAFHHMFRVDAFTIFLHVLLIAATAVVVLAAMDYLPQQNIERGEFYALLLFATVGMGFMVGSVELIMIFIGLEISSISSYVLCGFRRNDARSTESALKYFLLGSFATAFFLYGIALLYGTSGTTNLYAMAAQGLHVSFDGINHTGLVLAAAGLVFIGLGFKISAAPFQMWTPDVYEGAPALVTGFISAGPKAAAFAVALRIFYVALGSTSAAWFWMIWAAAILSMCIGNLGALLQSNIKRMLAYSSIAQAGYVLVAFAALGDTGAAAVLFYLAAYVAMNIGAFAIISHWAHAEEQYVNLSDYSGLGFRFPWMGFCFSIFLLSLLGVPMTGGFFGKLYVFQAALHAHLVGLTIVALLNSALAAFYYLRVIVYLYMRPEEKQIACSRFTAPLWIALAGCLGVTFWLGIFPSQALDYALKGAQQLLR